MADLTLDATGVVHLINPAEGTGVVKVMTGIPGALATYQLSSEDPTLQVGHSVACKVVKTPTGHTANGVRKTVG